MDSDRIGLPSALRLENANNPSVWVDVTMPTVHRFMGLRVVVYPNDHRPAHVHVMGKGCEAVFELNAPEGPPDLRENYGFTMRELAAITRELSAHLKRLSAAWRAIHGD